MTHKTQRASQFLKERAPEEIEIDGPADYYLIARASRENYKATYDMLFEDEEDFD